MNQRILARIALAMQTDNSKSLVAELSDLNGPHAVKYILEILCNRKWKNEHTIFSLLELINNGL